MKTQGRLWPGLKTRTKLGSDLERHEWWLGECGYKAKTEKEKQLEWFNSMSKLVLGHKEYKCTVKNSEVTRG